MRDAVNQNQEAPFPEPRAGEGFAAPLGLLAAGKRKEGLQRRGCCSSYGAGGSFQVDVPSSSPTQLSLPGPWGWYARSQGSHICGASIWDGARLPRVSKGGLSCLCSTLRHTGRQQANTSPEGVRNSFWCKSGMGKGSTPGASSQTWSADTSPHQQLPKTCIFSG